ncbi:hypothetical protein TNCV_4100161 [Trichonephila clavipes]|nr:hypothetical protein TNCV_4100161 [Trichonephila clavipes]
MVKSEKIPLIQTTNVPLLIYDFPSSSLWCRANPNLFRRSFEPFDQMLNHRMVLEPHMVYPISAGTRYILVTVQKTVFSLDIIPQNILPSSWRMDLTWGILEKLNGTIKRPTSYLILPRLMYPQRQTNDIWKNSLRLPPRGTQCLPHPSSDRLWILCRLPDLQMPRPPLNP